MADSGTFDTDTVLRRQKIADQLLLQASKPREIRHWAQGLGQMGEAGIYGALSGWEDRQEREGTSELAKLVAASLQNGGQQPTAAAPMGGAGAAPAPVPTAPAGAPTSDFMPNVGALPQGPGPDPAAKAIAGIESGGRYDLLGPPTKGDRAYGKYQVMGANVPPWTKAHLGQEMTPDQFLANPAAQDAVFKGQFGQYSKKYGPEGAAKAWFAGEGGMNNPNARDVLGTTVASYADKFRSGGGATAALQPPAGVPGVAGALSAPPQAQNAPAGSAGPVPDQARALIASLLDSKNPRAQKMGIQMGVALAQQQMKPPEYGFHVAGDTLYAGDKTRGTAKVVGDASKPIVVGENAQIWDPKTKSYIGGGAAPAPTSVIGPDGKPIAVPSGLSKKDAQEFTKRVTEGTADAAIGKKTEVQAKDEKFANKMELAEKNLAGIEGEGTGRISRALDAKVPGIGLGVPFGNSMQSDNYQKYRQARDNFITALLRDESGAAIGTDEFNRYEKELFPQPGDGVPVIEQKAEARRIAVEGMKKGAGPGYKGPTTGPGDAPTGVDAKTWKAMTPEERALWQK